MFVVVGAGFSYFNFRTPRVMILVALVAALFRCGEFLSSRTQRKSILPFRSSAVVSIGVGLVLPFALAASTQQFHTHYFGLLILPVLEAALYFSLRSTLLVAGIGSSSGMLWVAYAAQFRPPFQLGELLETATLTLLLFAVGALVWSLLDLLGKRDAELISRMQDLEATRGRLIEEEKLSAIGRLASAVAHEIRNPVAIISSAMEAARSPDLSAMEREDMGLIAFAESRRLEKLTTDFLSYAQPGGLPTSKIDLFLLVGYVASVAKAQALSKRVSIVLDMEGVCIVDGNEDQLQQALLNLVRNAIDASPNDGKVFLRCEPQEGSVRIVIENQGAAISAQAIPKIFEPFFTAKPGGTGLGLSIARKIANSHSGSLTLEINTDERICFVFLMPTCLKAPADDEKEGSC